MRTPFTIALLSLSLLIGCVKNPVTDTSGTIDNQQSSAVDAYVDAVFSQGWTQGGGIYRVIQRNTEEDPCLTAESIQYGGDTPKIVYSKRLCNIQIENTDVHLQDAAAIGYTAPEWMADGFHFRLEDDTRTDGMQFFTCTLAHFEQEPQLECVRNN